MNLFKQLRTGLANIVHGFRGFRGNIDGFIGHALVGWAVPRDASLGPLKIGVFSSQGLITQGTANVYRSDVAGLGISSGHNGFAIPLDAIMLRAIRDNGGKVQLRSLSEPVFAIGSYDFLRQTEYGTERSSEAAGAPLGTLQQKLFGAGQQLLGLLKIAQEQPAVSGSPPLARHHALFDTVDYINGGALPGLMTGYSEYLYYRDKLEDRFAVHDDPAETEHFLSWFLSHYSTLRGGLRVPIPKKVLDYLNEPIRIVGQRFSLTRATWPFLLDVPSIRNSMAFEDREWLVWAIYWWSIDRAEALHVEDCLVPAHYIDLLSSTPDGWEGSPFAPSNFMERIHRQTPALATLDLSLLEDRRRLVLCLMMMAVQRPDYLRYMPAEDIEALLAPSKSGVSLFAQFFREMTEGIPKPSQRISDTKKTAVPAQDAAAEAKAYMPMISRADYASVLRLKGFDLDTRSFLTITPEGHRVEAAALPAVADDEIVDLQVIGPFEKASGLGQATRLSASVIAEIGDDPAPITVNSVNFGLDNPAPEGFSRVGELSGYKRARVNLIHLNAESIPLAYAYQSDVFSGAYNIGYFFWELNTPAACHYLGMEMLDEIWVSTEYGVQIYQPEFKGPVSNVGMCYEELPEIPRAQARDFVQGLFGFEEKKFVFLVVFDSFSFVQRKNPIGVLKAFATAFEGNKDVRLVIKTQNRRRVADPVQIAIWKQVDALVKADKRIVVLNETLSYDDVLQLKKGCDAYVSLHKSEGWGFGMIEAMGLGVPVVCTAYSGNMDFCSEETAWLVGYEEVELAPNDYIFVREGQKWTEPDVADAARQMQAVYADPGARNTKATAGQAFVRQNFSAKAIAKRYETRLRDILKGL
jgi:glycosyltransferase involved in cell wall biosynthesis